MFFSLWYPLLQVKENHFMPLDDFMILVQSDTSVLKALSQSSSCCLKWNIFILKTLCEFTLTFQLASIGGVPDDIYDIWEVTGKRPEAKYTWDLKRNDNCAMASNFSPRCRFDRIYLRHCKPNPKLNPVYFELVGIERLKSCHRFPSDHWGNIRSLPPDFRRSWVS